MGPWVLPAPCCAAELARIPCSFAGLDQCQLPLHMHCDLEFYLFFLFRLLLKDYFGACSINGCSWCLLIWLCGPCAGFGFGAWSGKLSLCQVLLVNNFGLDPGVILVLDLNVLPAVTWWLVVVPSIDESQTSFVQILMYCKPFLIFWNKILLGFYFLNLILINFC